MNTLDAIYKRRSIKAFDADHRLTEEEEKTLFEATIQAPTSFNIQHWRFVILRDPELRQKIRTEFGNDQAQMTDASLLVLFTGDVKAWQKTPHAIGRMRLRKWRIYSWAGWGRFMKDVMPFNVMKPSGPSVWPCRP